MNMIATYIKELVSYGLNTRLIDPADEIYTTNKLLELFRQNEYPDNLKEPEEKRALHEILDDMLDYAAAQGLLPDDTITYRDLFDTKIMGMLTPPPSVVREIFEEKLAISPEKATDFYYSFSQDTIAVPSFGS